MALPVVAAIVFLAIFLVASFLARRYYRLMAAELGKSKPRVAYIREMRLWRNVLVGIAVLTCFAALWFAALAIFVGISDIF